MSNDNLHFDSYIGNENAEPLKRMARMWGGDHKQRKAKSIALICPILIVR